MNKPASAPDVIPSRQPERPVPGQGEGGNATQHEPDPQAEPLPTGEHKYVPRSPHAPRP
jgi:hypothetical protein